MADDRSDSHGSNGDGEESRDRLVIPSGKVVPLNSRRLTAAHLMRVAEALELPTTGSADQLRQLIEGKLESDRHVEVTNVQVVIQEEQCVELKLSLIDESGVILATEPTLLSKQETESEVKVLQEALAEANQQNSELNDQLADTVQKLEEERAETARLTEELASAPAKSSSATESENQKLKEELEVAKERYKKMWRLTCEQSCEQEELLVAQQEEINRLKRHASTRAPTPTSSPALSHSDRDSVTSKSTRDDPATSKSPPDDTILSKTSNEKVGPTKRRGKAPPIDSFTG